MPALPTCAIALCSAVLLPCTAMAADNLTLSATIRARAEAIDGQFRPAPARSSDAMLSLRTSLTAEYRAKGWRIGAELIDSRAYFQKTGSTAGTTEVNALELSQAWLALDLGPRASLTAGRFTVDVGSRRLVARNQFRNTSNAFTGLKLDWKGTNHDTLVALWTMPHYRLPDSAAAIADNAVQMDRESLQTQFFGASYTKAGIIGGTLEGYVWRLAERDSPALATRNRRLLTLGARLARTAKKGRVDYDLEAAWQTGTTRATTAATDRADLTVSAWFLHAELGHTFAGPWSPRIALQYDRGSGDGPAARYTRFDTLYGARRWEYGPTSLYGAVQRSNLSSPGARMELTPSPRSDLALAYRALWLASPTDSFGTTLVRDATGRSGSFAGHQFDLRLRHWLIPQRLRFEAGATYLAKGRFLRDAPNAPATGNTRHGYVDLTLNL